VRRFILWYFDQPLLIKVTVLVTLSLVINGLLELFL